MREAGDVCFADVQRDGEGVVEFLRREDMEYALRRLDRTEFRSHQVSSGSDVVHSSCGFCVFVCVFKYCIYPFFRERPPTSVSSRRGALPTGGAHVPAPDPGAVIHPPTTTEDLPLLLLATSLLHAIPCHAIVLPGGTHCSTARPHAIIDRKEGKRGFVIIHVLFSQWFFFFKSRFLVGNVCSYSTHSAVRTRWIPRSVFCF